MTRLLGIIVHNWPLKLAAVGLATVLYAGLVLSQGTYTLPPIVLPVQVENQPPDTYLLSPIPPVTTIRYFAAADVPTPTASSFAASVDLSGVDPKAGPVSVPVRVTPIDPRIQVVSFEPSVVRVALDPLESRTVPVVVEHGAVPSGSEIGDTTVEPSQVAVLGPKSIVDTVTAARADIVIQPGGIDVSEDAVLVAVDKLGNAVSPVEVDPRSAHVTIPVFTDRTTRTLPVSPVITGTPAAGFEIASVSVTPLTVTVEGDADELAALERVDTEAVSASGASSDFSRVVRYDLPPGVVPLGGDKVTVSVTLRPVTSTRTFEAGVTLDGAKSDLTYTVDVDRVLLTIGGSVADLDRLEGAALTAKLRVGELGPGTSEVPVTIDLPAGLTLVSATPATVRVTIVAPPSPSPSPAAWAAPSTAVG